MEYSLILSSGKVYKAHALNAITSEKLGWFYNNLLQISITSSYLGSSIYLNNFE